MTETNIHLLKSGAPAHRLTPEDRAKSIATRQRRKAEKLADLHPKALRLAEKTLDEGLAAAKGEINANHVRAWVRVVDQAEGLPRQTVVSEVSWDIDTMTKTQLLARAAQVLEARRLQALTVDGEATEIP